MESYDAGEKIKVDKIMVQSPLLKTGIGRVLKSYEYRPPFKPRWADLAVAPKDNGKILRRNLTSNFFHRIVEEDLQDGVEGSENYISNLQSPAGYSFNWAQIVLRGIRRRKMVSDV